MAEFIKLSDVETVETVSDNANVLIEDNGEIKKIPAGEISKDDNKGGVMTIHVDWWEKTHDGNIAKACETLNNDGLVNIIIDENGSCTNIMNVGWQREDLDGGLSIWFKCVYGQFTLHEDGKVYETD